MMRLGLPLVTVWGLMCWAGPAGAWICPDGTQPRGQRPPEGERIWCEAEDGTRDGPFRAWHSTGELKVRGTYLSGQKTGKWSYFFEDGTPRAAGTFAGDRMGGLWTWWYPTGRSAEEGEFVDGVEHGPWVFWHPSGRVAEAGVMQDGVRHGWWRQWAPDGELERMVRYDKGAEIDERQEDSSRFRGYGGLYSCWGYACGSWYRDCYAGWCDPFWDPYYRGYGYGYYGGFPVYRVYPGGHPGRPAEPRPAPSGLEPVKKKSAPQRVLPPSGAPRSPAKRAGEPGRKKPSRLP